MSRPSAAAEGEAHAENPSIDFNERALRRKYAADKVAQFPIVEYAMDLHAYGGTDMRGEAQALAALMADFAERMRRPR